MSYRTFKRSIALMVMLLIAMVWAKASGAHVQANGPGEQSELDQLFKKARQNFLGKKFKDAATDIRKGESFRYTDTLPRCGKNKKQVETEGGIFNDG